MTEERFKSLHELGFIWDLYKPATAADIARTGVVHGNGGGPRAVDAIEGF